MMRIENFNKDCEWVNLDLVKGKDYWNPFVNSVMFDGYLLINLRILLLSS
jgi:hypothetical protein